MHSRSFKVSYLLALDLMSVTVMVSHGSNASVSLSYVRQVQEGKSGRLLQQLHYFLYFVFLICHIASLYSPRIYGGCFGCQIIAHALGGIVDFNPGERFLLKAETIEVIDNFENYLLSSSPSFSSSFSPSSTFDKCGCLDSDVEVDHKYDNTIEGGVRDLHLKTENVGEINDEEVASERTERILREKTENEKELEIIFANKLNEIKDSKKVMKSYNIIVSHGDCVCALPPKALLLGSSMSCTNEMYVTGVCGNIFGCQSHPEFHYDYAIKERIWKSVVHLNKKLTEDELRIAKDTFALYSRKDSDELLQLIRKFLCVSHCKRNI